MRNLKEETLKILESHGYSIGDVAWVGSVDYEIPVDRFWELADVEYDSGFGCQEVASDLMVVLDDGSWLERNEYDGSECWEHKKTPERPGVVVKNAFAVVERQALRVSWQNTVFTYNKPVIEAMLGGDAS